MVKYCSSEGIFKNIKKQIGKLRDEVCLLTGKSDTKITFLFNSGRSALPYNFYSLHTGTNFSPSLPVLNGRLPEVYVANDLSTVFSQCSMSTSFTLPYVSLVFHFIKSFLLRSLLVFAFMIRIIM